MTTTDDPDAILPLDFLREVVHPGIRSLTAEMFKESATPSRLYRLTLHFAPPDEWHPDRLILKRIAPGWPADPRGHERETNFYRQAFPRLDIPQPDIFYAGPAPASDENIVLAADISATYWFPPPTYRWTEDEVQAIMRAYARFHAQGPRVLGQQAQPPLDDTGWLFPRHEERVREMADALPEMAAELDQWGQFPPLSGFRSLLDRTLAETERIAESDLTLLHGDLYPPNIGLPRDGSSDVMLVDWEMFGPGLPEMDLAYMFLQPYGAARNVDRRAAMDIYWREWERAGAVRLPPEERARRQRYADRLFALWLVPVAHRMAADPYPPGSPVRDYWDHMMPVLAARLARLCDEL